uniref:tyrosine-type recombinase/integrase n=1 Tax=Candidatus Fimivicinus sp. TaxID=3056640 RepID=UPI00402898A8
MDVSQLDLRIYIDYTVSEIMSIDNNLGFRVTLVYRDGDSRVRQHGGFKNKKEARSARETVIAQLHAGLYVTYTNVLTKDWLEYWLEIVMRPNLTSDSYVTYKNCIYKHLIPKVGNLRLLEINKGHILKILNELLVDYPSLCGIAKPILKGALRYALSKRLIMTDPCKDVRIPRKNGGKDEHDRSIIKIDEKKTLSLDQVKILIDASKNSKIYMQILFALLMGLRRGEINGLKYSDIDYKRHTIKVQRQLGIDPHLKPEAIPAKNLTKQEIKLKTRASYRTLDIPDIVFEAILEERKKYEKNRRRRPKEFQDLDYICCSSYGRPRSKNYHFKAYKQLLKENDLPDIRFHDLRHTYATLLIKNNISEKAVAAALGHSTSRITLDVYTDMKAIVDRDEYLRYIEPFIEEISPKEKHQGVEKAPRKKRRITYDHSNVRELRDIHEWYFDLQ